MMAVYNELERFTSTLVNVEGRARPVQLGNHMRQYSFFIH